MTYLPRPRDFATRRNEDAKLRIPARKGKRRANVVVRIIDDGPGIPPEIQGRTEFRVRVPMEP